MLVVEGSEQAFRINACKKVVLLSKLIQQFTHEAHDRLDKLNEVHYDFQRSCQSIVDKFNRESGRISKDLNQFRKDYISDTCSQFAEEYKEIKKEFTKYKNSQIRKLNAIIAQSKNLQQTVQLIQNSALKTASDTLNSASEMEEHLQSHTSPEYMQHYLQPYIQPILDKTNKYQTYCDDRIRRMKGRYNDRSETIREKYQNEIKNVYRLHYPYFETMRTKIKDLKTCVFDSRMQVTRTIDSNKMRFKLHHNKKNSYIRDTAYLCKEIDDKLFLEKERYKTVMSVFTNEINDIKNQRQTKIRNQTFKLDFLNKMITDKERQYQLFVDGWNKSITKRVYEISTDQAQSNQFGSALIDEKKEKINNQLIKMKECDDDNKKLNDSLRSKISTSISLTEEKHKHFQTHLKEQIIKITNILRSLKDMYSIQRRGRLFIFEKGQNLKITSNSQKIEEIMLQNNKLKQSLQELMKKQNEEIKIVEDDSQKSMESKSNKIKEQLNEYIQTKKGEYEKDQHELQLQKQKIMMSFSKELTSTEKHYSNMIQHKISNMKDFSGLFNENPTDVQKVTELRTKLEMIENDIKSKVKTHNDITSDYEKQISNLEKLQRMFLRNKQNETNAIKTEYEVKIQVAQVTLNERLENLSKIYDPDENQRGCDIVEAFRHIKEVRLHKSDFIANLKNECQQLKKEQQNQMSLLEQKKKYLLTAEKELKEKYKVIKEKASIEIPQLQNVLKQEVKPLQALIIELNEKFDNETKGISVEKKKENENYLTEVKKIENEKQQIENDVKSQLKKIEEKYTNEIKKVKEEHQKNIKKLKLQIKQSKELKQKIVNEQQKIKMNEFTNFCNQLKTNIKNSRKQQEEAFAQVEEDLDKKFKDTINQVLQYDLVFSCNLPRRRIDTKKLETKRAPIPDYDNKIATEFNAHARYIKQPNLIVQREMQNRAKVSSRKSVKRMIESPCQNNTDHVLHQVV